MILVDLFCTECDERFIDVFIDTKEPLPVCTKCGAETKKLIAAVGFQLKYNNRTDICDWNGNTTRYFDDIKKTGGDEPENDRQPRWV